ncbi:MAG: glycoside hydrolase family 3 C-terminal domain-containing protein, partial [Clostridiales Family XIII bacterium]|nr:glycoside hydrolase family 3 C-terminal domain-containing protein [Clostridiales Family XIII bacterium]
MKKPMKYAELIAQMTTEEKASLMSGGNFWNTKSLPRLSVPSMMLTDGPHGLRKQGGKADHLGLHRSLPATCFPTAATLANSWDTELLRDVGACLGREAAAENVSVVLGPGLNIKRSPLCGRNFEYFSEDPYLSGKLAAAMIQGIQGEGVAACPKHFAVNSQETRRMVIDEVVDERAMREIYLEGFRYAVTEGGAKSVMTSYNKVNGVFANENRHLLQDILTEEWGFDGLIVTDWGGGNDRVAGLVAGNALEMPSTFGETDSEILCALRDGTLDESLLDERVDSLLELLYDTQPAMGKGRRFTYGEHHEAARRAARESIVLLKNDNDLLPLQPGSRERIAVIGDFAEAPRYQGAGSSLVNPWRIDNALDALRGSGLVIAGYEPGFRRSGRRSASLIDRAVKLAGRADIALVFLGLGEIKEAEGVDRSDMRIDANQVELLSSIHAVCGRVIVALCGGSPVEMPWIDQAGSVVHAYLGGQAGGPALADVLTGRCNPSGKLAESYPVRCEDVPSASFYPGTQLTTEHRESLYVGYRYYGSAGKDVLFPFGHGLSYADFEYSGVDFDTESNEVSFTLRNASERAGAEIAQVYISKLGDRGFRPEKELKGFVKIFLEPGEERRANIKLDEHAFACWSGRAGDWEIPQGEYAVLVGASSRDIRLTHTLGIEGLPASDIFPEGTPHCYLSAAVTDVGDEDFTELLGHPLPESGWDEDAPIGLNDTIAQSAYKGKFAR